MLKIDRRVFTTGLGAAALALHPASALAQGVNVDDLHAPGQLGEKVLGPADAPVTVVEYASFTCPHCATFHNAILDDFKTKYIDSGEVRLIFREFLRNGADVAVSAVARCAPADRYFEVVEGYFAAQDQWLTQEDLRQAILNQAKEYGFTEDTFNACLGNQNLLKAFDAGMQRAQSFGVTGTPTFFVNGEKHVGALPMDQWDAIIGPKLAEAGE
jgi:protein-disulfide isomerase